MKRIFVVWLSALLCLITGSYSSAALVRFDFSGKLIKPWGSIAEGSSFHGHVVYDTDTEGIWVGNNTGQPTDPPTNGWEKRQYAFEEFSLTVDGETFFMNGHPPTDRSANPYGTIFVTKFPDPSVDQFFVSISPLYHGFGSPWAGIPNEIWEIGGRKVRQIQMAFSAEKLFEDTGPYLLDAERLQEKFDMSTRAVMTLVAPDYYAVSSPLKEGNAAPVPEPASILLLGAGLLGIGSLFKGIGRK